MKKEIKFRAWVNGQMEHSQDTTLEAFFAAHENLGYTQDTSIIMQFTGLKDVNGKEVYEADILRIKDDVFGAYLRTVHYNPYKALYHPQDLDKYDFEIIGNKYENPELPND